MNPPFEPGRSRLIADNLTLIDERCDRFERNWSPSAQLHIDDYLDGVEGEVRTALWLELVMVDQQLRQKWGEAQRTDEYERACPDNHVWLDVSSAGFPAAAVSDLTEADPYLNAPAEGWLSPRNMSASAARHSPGPDHSHLADTATLALVFGPSGTRRSVLMLVDASSGRVARTVELPAPPTGVAFVAGGTEIATVEGPEPTSGAAVPNPFVDFDLWNATTLQQLGDTTNLPGYLPRGAEPSPDGAKIVTGTTNGVALVWDLDPNTWQTTACRVVGRSLTKTEWAQYLPGRKYRTLCPQPADNG